jgi:hypothetical protein
MHQRNFEDALVFFSKHVIAYGVQYHPLFAVSQLHCFWKHVVFSPHNILSGMYVSNKT